MDTLYDITVSIVKSARAKWAGMPAGDTLRSIVPTTYDPANEPLPLPGIPSGGTATPAQGTPGALNVFCFIGANTASIIVTLELTGPMVVDPPQVVVFETPTMPAVVPGLPPGATASITFAAKNTTGQSAPSAPIQSTVAAE